MKKHIKITFAIVLFMIIGVFAYNHFNSPKIDKVLKTSDYSYLPVEAQNFIEKVYNDTGEIIFTEKNKVENVPYLNPKYIEYITLSEEEQAKVEEVPEIYTFDYTIREKVDGDLPSSYDLRNVSGKNFITPLKNQQNLDLCWAFTSTEQIESMLLINSNTSYTSGSSEVFSPRQLDYASSYNGIRNYHNELGSRALTYGGNYFMAAISLSNGFGTVNESFFPFSTSTTQKDLASVLNYGNGHYEINNSISVPLLTSSPTTEQLNAYTSTVKNYVIQYGGVYVSTQAPDASCAATNSDGNSIIRPDGNCTEDSSHAMQIIGWDDNYSYSYCVSNNEHKAPNTCSSGKVTGKGAWILRNSWGNNYPYVYLAYDAINYDIRVTTSISPMSSRTWDNSYYSEYEQYYMTLSKNASKYYKKKIDTAEKIEKVKFYVYGEGGQFKLSIASKNERYNNIKSFTVEHAGLYTIDLHNENVVITDSGFSIEIMGSNNVSFVRESVEAFTSNVSNNPVIETDDIYVKNTGIDYNFVVYSKTKNIPSNTTINYSLKNSSGSNYSNYLSVAYNKVAKNDINAEVTISNSIPTGVYDLILTYNNQTFASKVYLGASMDLSGSGTTSSPYIIQSEADLKQMAYDLGAHYKLSKNISITNEWVPIGTKDNPFTGSLDGNGYKITNLMIENEHEYNGLFGYVSINDQNTTSFKNITFESPVIDATGDAGVLIGVLTGKTNLGSSVTCSATIQDVFVLNGHVYSYFGNAGAIVGKIEGPINDYMGKHTYTFNRIFSSTSVGGVRSSGMIGLISGATISANTPTIKITNIENTGWMDYSTVRGNTSLFYTGTHGSIIGYGSNYAKINLNNYLTTAYYRNLAPVDDGVIGYVTNDITLTKGSGYSILDENIGINDLIDESKYSSWSGFSTNWVKSTVNDVSRIPIIKNVNLTYSNISDITINVGDVVNLSNYLNIRKDSFTKLWIGTPNVENIISVEKLSAAQSGLYYDVRIKGLAQGTTKFYAYNAYDGFKKVITVTVNSNNPKTTITFHKNDGSPIVSLQSETYGSQITLNANSFSRTGYSFSKWNTEADGSGTNYTNKQTFTTNLYTLNLYAQWYPNTYVIKYNANGGSGTMSNSMATYDDYITLRDNLFTKTGYVFDSWNTKANGSGDAYTNQQSVKNLTSTDGATVNIYAQWKSISYTIKYNANGGSGNMSNTSATYNTNVTLRSNTFTRDGYTFTGWNTKADGSGTSYSNGASVSNLTSTNNGTVTLYAQWRSSSGGDNSYSINYDTDENNMTIDGIALKTSLSSYQNHFTLNGYTMSISLGDKQYIYTGSKVSILLNGSTEATFTNIVRGDTSGDGQVNSADMLQLRQHMLNAKTLTGVYFKAGDIDNNNAINSADLLRMRQHLLGVKPIS